MKNYNAVSRQMAAAKEFIDRRFGPADCYTLVFDADASTNVLISDRRLEGYEAAGEMFVKVLNDEFPSKEPRPFSPFLHYLSRCPQARISGTGDVDNEHDCYTTMELSTLGLPDGVQYILAATLEGFEKFFNDGYHTCEISHLRTYPLDYFLAHERAHLASGNAVNNVIAGIGASAKGSSLWSSAAEEMLCMHADLEYLKQTRPELYRIRVAEIKSLSREMRSRNKSNQDNPHGLDEHPIAARLLLSAMKDTALYEALGLDGF